MSVFKPGLDNVADGGITKALDGAKVADEFFKQLDGFYQKLPDDVGLQAGQIIMSVLCDHTRGFRPEHKHVAMLGLLLAVSANMATDLVSAVEPSLNLAHAKHDGRLIAVRMAFSAILDDARFARAAGALMGGRA